MKNIRRFIQSAALVTALGLSSLTSVAQDARKEAAALSAEGAAKFDEADFAGALEKFSRAYAIYKVPTIGVFVARCQHALGRHAAALLVYDEVIAYPVAADTPKQVKQAIDEARSERQEVAQQVSWVDLQITGPTSYQVFVDGVETRPASGTKYAIDAGTHVLMVRADGFSEATQKVEAAATQEQVIALTLTAAEAAPAAPAPVPGEGVFQGPTFAQDKYAQEEKLRREKAEAERKRQAEAAEKERVRQQAEKERRDREAEELATLRKPYIIPGYIVTGVGVLGLGVSYFSYQSASDSKDALDDQCIDGRCPKSAESDLDSAKSSASIATYSLIAGTAATGVGVYLLVRGYTISLPSKEGAWQLTVQPGGLGVRHTY